jgi:hypothetical protein
MAGLADLISEKTSTPDPQPSDTETGSDLTAAPEAPEPLGLESDEGEPDKPKSIPYARFAEVNSKRKDAESKLSELETRLNEQDEVGNAFRSIYSKFSDPVAQMREDADFAKTVWDLREHPDVKKALQIVNQHFHNGKEPKLAERTETNTPTADPRVDALMQERLREKTDGLLEQHKVRPELRSVIANYVVAQNPNPSSDAILNVVREFVSGQGWTRDFLSSAPAKPKRTAPPTPTGRSASAPVEKKEEVPRSLSAYQRQNRSRLQELIRTSDSTH